MEGGGCKPGVSSSPPSETYQLLHPLLFLWLPSDHRWALHILLHYGLEMPKNREFAGANRNPRQPASLLLPLQDLSLEEVHPMSQ